MSGNSENRRKFHPLQEISEEEEARIGRFFDNVYDSDDDDEQLENVVYDDESDFDDITAPNTCYVPNYDEFEDAEIPEELHAPHGDEEEALEPAITPNRGQKYTSQGKGDKTIWWSMPAEEEKERTARMRENRMRSFAYSKENFDTKLSAFMRVFPPSIVGQIVIETNRKASRVYATNLRSDNRKRMRPWKDTNVDELYAYIAILLYSGAEKAHNTQAIDLFHKSNMPFYRAVMSLERFEQLSRFLRFDDSRTRLVRLREDKLAPIRYIWDLFQKNMTAAYVPSLDMVVDEQLLTTRNRCSFRQYIPSKPGKYGIKLFWVVDSATNFPLSAEVYLGQQPNQARSTGVAHDLVLRLMKDYFHLGVNLTMDNFFVSYALAEELVEKETTITGTIRSNKRELPKIFTSAEEAKKRGPNKAIFCFSNSCELVSYTAANTGKNVLLLTTAYATEEINSETGKPLIIHGYNQHKGGVDTFDQMLRGYTCKRKNCRWPMVLFNNMLDVAAFAAYRLFELSNPAWLAGKSIKRKIFLKELSYDLAKNHLDNRCKAPLKKTTRIAMDLIGFKPKVVCAPKLRVPEIQVNKKSLSLSLCFLLITVYILPIFSGEKSESSMRRMQKRSGKKR